jgi:isopenicillin N synthase-like dioxygenase
MQIFAVALDLPIDFFEPMLSHHASNLALFNYPDQPTRPKRGQLRGGAHTDFGSLSIVHSDWTIPGGLQVQTKAGSWMDVAAPRDAFVINIGDMMARWTNDRWVSTLHRVANPETSSARSYRRQSVIFFHVPNQDALVECIPSCRDADNPPKYKPITVGEHHLMKMGKMFEEV